MTCLESIVGMRKNTPQVNPDVSLIYGFGNSGSGTMPRVYLLRERHSLYAAFVNHPCAGMECLHDGLCVPLGRLIESGNLRRRMGSEGRRSMVEGKFSMRRRDVILKEACGSCLRM